MDNMPDKVKFATLVREHGQHESQTLDFPPHFRITTRPWVNITLEDGEDNWILTIAKEPKTPAQKLAEEQELWLSTNKKEDNQ